MAAHDAAEDGGGMTAHKSQTRRILPPDAEIVRVVNLAQSLGLEVVGLDVGRDYVRTIPPSRGGESVEQYLGSANRSKGSR